MPDNPDDPKNGLYEEIKDASSRNLRNSVEKVDGITPEEEEALERGGRFALRGTMRRIGRWCLWVGFFAGLVFVLGALAAIAYLTYSYVTGVVDSGRTEAVITAILSFVFGIVATLAVEFIWHLSTKRQSGGQ